jgi:hypothetical protein
MNPPWRRLLPAAAAVAYVAAVVVWVGGDRRAARAVFPAGSAWNTGDDGLSLAFAYLSARAARAEKQPPGARVAILSRRLDPATLPARAVVFRVEPRGTLLDRLRAGPEAEPGEEPASRRPRSSKRAGGTSQARTLPTAAERPVPLLTAAEEEWVRGGGRLVLALAAPYGPLAVDAAAPGRPVRKVFPIWPGVEQLRPAPLRTLGGRPLAGAHALWVAGEAPVAARLALGAGDVLVLACPEVLHNRLLGQADHLALLAALAGQSERTAAGRPVFFDEGAHGALESTGILEILRGWGLGPLLLLLALAGAAAWWRAAVRIGPADRDEPESRSEAVELVDSLADLYERALGRADLVRLFHDSFVRTLAAETGLQGAALAARAGELCGGFAPAAAGALSPPPLASALPAGARPEPEPDLSRAAFAHALQTLNEAFRRLQDAQH